MKTNESPSKDDLLIINEKIQKIKTLKEEISKEAEECIFFVKPVFNFLINKQNRKLKHLYKIKLKILTILSDDNKY